LTGPSGDEPGTVGGGLVDDLADAAPLLVVDDRPDRDLLGGGIAHRQVPGTAGQLLDVVVGDRFVDEVAAGGHADLSLVHPRTESPGRGGRTDLGAGRDDERIVAAELQVAALEEATCGRVDLAPGRGRSCEGDDVDLGGGDGGLTGVEPTGQDLEEPLGQTRLGEDPGQGDTAADRGAGVGFEQDRVAQGQLRGDR